MVSEMTLFCLQVSADTLWFGDGIKEAIQRRRLHHQLVPNNVTYEAGYDQVSAKMERHWPIDQRFGPIKTTVLSSRCLLILRFTLLVECLYFLVRLSRSSIAHAKDQPFFIKRK